MSKAIMTESNKVFISAILIMGIVVLLTTAGSIYFLYRTAVQEQKGRLLEVVKSQARFIEVYHETHSTHGDDMTAAAHMSHNNELEEFFSHLTSLFSSDRMLNTKAAVLNFYIADKRGEFAYFYIGTSKLTNRRVPLVKLEEKPMGMALSGKTGALETVDHLGKPILCSFTFAPSVGMGIVSKIFLADLRAPFIKTGLITYAVALVLFLTGGLVIRMRVSPMVVRLETQRRELERMNTHLHKLATTDTLTELFNRQHFNEQLTYGISLVSRHNHHLAIMILDVDHFKAINDSLGHLAGDAVLVELSRLLEKNIRKSDILARWGGEEFAILLLEAGGNDAHRVAQKFCDLISNHDFGINQQITYSFGVTVFRAGESPNDFINRADEGLYEAKNDGRNRVVLK